MTNVLLRQKACQLFYLFTITYKVFTETPLSLRHKYPYSQSFAYDRSTLDTALQANEIGHLEYRYPSERLYDGVMEQSIDGHHQVGTTRMGDDPRDSVVDPNLKVHGVDNLYVVSTSVYRTDGQANSTLPAVAFAMRLAHHIHCLADNPDYVTMSARA